MTANRLEAFSDGVLAIIITIMVLELKIPGNGHTWEDLKPVIPVFLSYILSFIYVGIYWNNHHHLIKTIKNINGQILWANLHLLFWLSLVPFVTSWLGENYDKTVPVVVYGFVLFMAAVAYTILVRFLIKMEGSDSNLAKSIGKDFKGKLSVLLYLSGIGLSFIQTWLGIACYIIVAAIWFLPDKRLEKSIRVLDTE